MKTAVTLVLIILAGFFIFADRPTSPSLSIVDTDQENLVTPITPEDEEKIDIHISLIALEDNGATGKKIGCNDSVVSVTRTVPYTSATLRAALDELLSLNETTYGESGFYNALAPSNLTLGDVRIEEGQAIIDLEGQLILQGVCDAPRIQAQLEETAAQFSSVSSTTINVNGEPLANALSAQ